MSVSHTFAKRLAEARLKIKTLEVKYPDASIRGIKLVAMQASGYLALAAVAKYPCKHGYLARCFAGIKNETKN